MEFPPFLISADSHRSAPTQTQGDKFPVVRIKEGGTDLQDRLITRVYAMRPGKYAVYLAGDVRIEYADDADEEAAQRASVVASVGKIARRDDLFAGRVGARPAAGL